MALRLMLAAALSMGVSLGVGATVLALWPEPPLERVMPRAEAASGRAEALAQAASCAPSQPQRVPADI